jgi:hypothetical protein
LTTGEDQPKGDDATRPEEAEVSAVYLLQLCGISCIECVNMFELPCKRNYRVSTIFRALLFVGCTNVSAMIT